MFTEPIAHKLRIGFVRVFLLCRMPDDKRTRLLILGGHERPRERVVQAEAVRGRTGQLNVRLREVTADRGALRHKVRLLLLTVH
jgi:hypothetical protein